MNWLKQLFKKNDAPKPKQGKRVLTPKEIATERGEPWIEIKNITVNPHNPGQGSVEFDWNEKFIADLQRHGYQIRPDDTDADLVDRWFTEVCKNVVLETWEQEQAHVTANRPIKSRDLGEGRSEIS